MIRQKWRSIRSLANKMAKKWRSQSRFGETESLFGEIESRFGEENGEVNRALTKKMAKSIALWRRKWRSQSRFGEENGEVNRSLVKKMAKKWRRTWRNIIV